MITNHLHLLTKIFENVIWKLIKSILLLQYIYNPPKTDNIMGMTTKEMLAKNVPANAFVYLPKKNLFLFVNSIVDYDNKLEFIFEIDSQQEIVYTFSYDELVFVVAEYSTEMCYLKNLEKTI